jgi:DNA-binding transcriptional LysR family regulator
VKNVDVVSLTRFVAIAEHQSFRAASRALYIAQPTLTKQMQELEEGLGIILFERGRWGVRLTRSGEALLVRARSILEQVEDLPATIRDPFEVVRVGAASTAAGSFLAPFLGKWIPAHPEVQIRLIEDGLSGLVDRLRRRECDVALVASPVPEIFDYRPILNVQVHAIFPVGHELADTDEPVTVEQIARYPILVSGEGFLSTRLFRAACGLVGVDPVEIYQSPVGQTLAALVENGLGVAVLAESVDLRGFALPKRIVLGPGGAPLQFTINVAFEKRLHLAPGLQRFIGDLSTEFPDVAEVTTSESDRGAGLLTGL